MHRCIYVNVLAQTIRAPAPIFTLHKISHVEVEDGVFATKSSVEVNSAPEPRDARQQIAARQAT